MTAYTRAVRRSLSPAALALAATVLLACGCGGGGEAAPATTGSSTQAGEGIDVLAGASTAPVTVSASNAETALLADVRAARHEGYDRVVFEFRNVLPGYDVRYVDRPVRQDASGDVVRVEGAHVLQVRMENALDADLTKEAAPLTYTGPQRFSPGTATVVELVRTGGFEAILTWAVGLADRVDFRVSTLTAPPRLVIDLRNH